MEKQSIELHSSSVSESSGTRKVFVFNCPYLGTVEDSDTSLAYPASANHCFRVDSPTAVELSHQEAYCLTDQHPGCHVFQMAEAGITDTESMTNPPAPEKRKRSLGLYAFPLILVLILLAAIVWWPAPGTTIQESLVRGAQNDKEISGGVSLNGKPEQQSVETEEAVEVTVPDVIVESPASVGLNDSYKGSETVGEKSSSAATTDNNSSNDVQSQTSPATDAISAPEQLVEAAVPTETGSEPDKIASKEISSEEVPIEDESSNKTIDSAASEPIVTVEIAVDSPPSESTDEATEEAGQRPVSAEAAVETEEVSEESPAVVTADLPILSADVVAADSPSTEPVTTNAAGELVTLVGPVLGTVLSLRDSSDSDDVAALAVYQDPASESTLLSSIASRQFITLLGRDESGAWLNVLLNNGVEGWINTAQSDLGVDVSTLPFGEAAAVSESVTEQSIPAATSYPVLRSAIVDTGALNVRSGPSIDYEAITIINSGEIVGLLGRRALGPWVRIRTDNGLEGWVNSSLLAQIS